MNKCLLNVITQIGALCLLITLIGCNPLPVMPELTLAEKLMEQEPDSALKIIQGIETPENLSEKDHAFYCLLLTLASDKNYIRHTSDSVIKIAADYFDKHNDTAYGMLAYYCMGRVNTDLEDALQAQECYLKALELSENSDNYRLLVKINNNLATLYSYQDIYDLALPTYKKALQYAMYDTSSDSLNISFILRNIARTYAQTHASDSAIYYYKEALKYCSPLNVSSILVDLGNSLADLKKFTEAKAFIDQAGQSTNIQKTLWPIYLSKGRLFEEMGQLDSAKHYLKQSAQSSNIYTKAGSFQHLAQVALKEHNNKDYVKYSYIRESLRDTIIDRSHFENIRMTQSMFNYQRIAKEKNKYEKEAAARMILIYRLIIGSAVLLIIGIFLFRREQEKKKHLLAIKEQQYKRSQKFIEDNKKKIEKLEQALSTEQVQKDEVKKQLLEAQKVMLEIENIQFYQKQGVIQILEKDFHTTNLYTRIHGIEEIQLTANEWVELRYLIDSTYPDFTNRLIREYNKITKEEIYICYLVKMNVPIKKIAAMIHISSSGVSQCRRRLYKKFTNEPESAENFDKFIADF